MEYGGHAGIDSGRRELWLFHCLSPAWVAPGKKVLFRNAPTEFGKISAEMVFDGKGAKVAVAASFHETPSAYRFRIPYFKELVSFKTDARTSRQEGDCIVISPDATVLEMEWSEKQGIHDSVFEDLLLSYRSTDLFNGVDADGRAVIETQKPFLRADEKAVGPRPLSFDVVRQAFCHDYARRADKCVEEGGSLIKVKAPM